MSSTFRERQLPPAEVRRVLRRAAEIAETDPETASAERALTQGELTRRAAELGLPASAVARAIGAPEAPAPDGQGPWLASRVVTLERSIPGELPIERYEEIVHAIVAAAGGAGRTEVVGTTVMWYEGRAARPLVTIRSRDGHASVKVEGELDGASVLAAYSMLGVFLALMGGAVTMDTTRAALPTAAVASLLMVCTVFAMTFVSARVIRRREALLHRVMEQTASAVASAVALPAAANPVTPPRARIAPTPDPAPSPAPDPSGEAELDEAAAEENAQRVSYSQR